MNMGQRNSKSSKSSYEVAPVVSDKDFKYEKPNEPEETMPKESEIDTKCVPAWVNEAQFVDLLQENVKNFEEIIKMKAYPAMTAGENYLTLMLRVSIEAKLKDGSKQDISLMMKVPHDNEQMRKMMEHLDFFLVENCMYFNVIPELEQMYTDAGQDVTFAAKAYKFPNDPGSSYVLLDDLRPRGFKNVNRLECLDLKHTECVLQMMAKFHAASATRVAIKGPFPDICMNVYQSQEVKQDWENVMVSFHTAFANNVELYKDGDRYKNKVKLFFDNINNEFVRLSKYDPEAFNVLNHGDSWSNNILFKYAADGQIADTIYVDFQVPKYGTPAQDLLYFIMSSVNIENKLKRFDYFIRFYYEHLIDNLKLLKYPKKLPTLRELHMQLFKNGSYAFTTSMLTLPVVLLDPTESACIANFIFDNDAAAHFKNAMFSSKRYGAYISEILPWLYDRGLIDLDEFAKQEENLAIKPNEKPTENATKSEQAAMESNSLSAPQIPEWISEDYFLDILKDNIKEFKQIKKFAVNPATNAGDNYASVVLKVDIEVELVDGSSQLISYMLKVVPTGEQAQIVLAILNTFQKELIAYGEILPQLNRIYKEAGVTDITFAPKCYHFTKDPGCETVLMENIAMLGFKCVDRLNGFDVAHTESVLQKLAQFHAASAYWCATGGSIQQILHNSLYSVESREMLQPLADIFFDFTIGCIKDYKGSEEYADKIVKYKSTFFDLMIKASEADESSFNVINHGDCWINNILFQYNADGSIKDTCFVDFQLVKYGSPVQDLYSLLMSSTNLEIKMDKFDHFIEFYYEHLKSNLELLKYPKDLPTLEDIQKDLHKYGAWGFAALIDPLETVLLESTASASLDNMLGEDDAGMELKRLMYCNDRYRSHAEVILAWMNKRGILDLV